MSTTELSLEELSCDLLELVPSDIELLDVLVEYFDLTRAEMIERLICVDFVALRKELP